MMSLGEILVSMIGTIAVIDLIAIILQGKKAINIETETLKISKWKKSLILGIIGGLFGIYATLNGYTLESGAIVAIRDVGPMMAGCLGGPLSGLISGIIAGLFRLYQGFPDIFAGTSIPCAISTVLIGLICGLLFKSFSNNKKRGTIAFLIGIFMEILHLTIAFIYIWIMKDFLTSVDTILEIAPSFLLSNSLGFGLLIFTTDMIEKYKVIETNKEKIENDLKTAENIQTSMLPADFPIESEFEMYACMYPAKQVGGDFYDFFYIDKDHLAFIIGDVSGKGVSAALYMVIAKTIIKNNLKQNISLAEAIEKSNKQLFEDNKEDMFVTAWIGILEISTGIIKYVNAGHNPPIYRNEKNDIFYVKNRSGFILAVNENSKYETFELQLQKNDILFIYTDGVTEANSKDDSLYGADKLCRLLLSEQDTSMKMLCNTVKKDLDQFSKDIPQFDDITMIALKYMGGK